MSMKNSNKVISVRLPSIDLDKLLKLAAPRRTTVSQIVREAVANYLREEKKGGE